MGRSDGGKCLLVSDHGDEQSDQLRSDGIAGRADGKQRDGVDLRDAHGTGDIHGNTQRDQ